VTHDPSRCPLCSPLRHPSAAQDRRELNERGLIRQTRTNGENTRGAK